MIKLNKFLLNLFHQTINTHSSHSLIQIQSFLIKYQQISNHYHKSPKKTANQTEHKKQIIQIPKKFNNKKYPATKTHKV